jgi:hypothetical protein
MRSTIAACAVLLMAASWSGAQPRDPKLTDFTGWEVLDPGGRLMPYLGRPSLFLYGGIALMPGTPFADGTIEFDVAIHGQFGFAGVIFRGASPDDYELIYLRTHRSRQWDALQYTPIIAGQESWQLYAGAGYNAAVELPANRWLHVRIVVDGYSAAVFVDGESKPRLVVTDLKRDWRAGRVGLWGRAGAAHFSNVTVTPRVRPEPQRQLPSAAEGMISRWSISQSFAASALDLSRIPDAIAFNPITSEPSGIVNIAQYRSPARARPRVDDGRNTVFAKTVLRAPRASRIRLTIGYSDDVTVFLDGQPIFAGRSGYLLRDGSDLGTLSVGPETLFLDLAAGRHELIFGVTEAFGGWGVAARIDGAPEITIER